MIGVKPSEGNDNSVWDRSDLMPGQQVNLSKWFNCEPEPGNEDSLQNSSNPFIKHCPVQGRNTTAAGAIVFDKVHTSAQAEGVSFELMLQFKRACKKDDKFFLIDDFIKRAHTVLIANSRSILVLWPLPHQALEVLNSI
jgi:hypothetical protein